MKENRLLKKVLFRLLTGIISILLLIPVGAATGHPSTMYQYAGVLGNDTGASSPQYNMGNPVAISKDTYGYYYVADLANNRILKLNSAFSCVSILDKGIAS